MPLPRHPAQALFPNPQSRPPILHPSSSFSAITDDERTPTAFDGHTSFPTLEYDNDDEASDDADFQSHYSLEVHSSSGSSESGTDQFDSSEAKAPFLHHSNSSFLIANAFAPPFYNRPPTPLPPSPSLTSLLRPSFSTTTSRPTTPDSSENDTPNDTEAAVAKSARTATTVPRASPKVPTYEYYGFVLYLVSSLAFLIYLLWSYLPSPFLHQLGIYYYPNRWWSLAIPSFLVMCIVYIYVALASYNTEYLTLPMSSIENIVDEAANVAVLDAKGRIRRKGRGDRRERQRSGGGMEEQSRVGMDWKDFWSEGTDAVMDVPVDQNEGGTDEVFPNVASFNSAWSFANGGWNL
ncbi:hypothetical protein MMC12_007069 [Toensbergia leucococca]|nr:hypothetical protein [Toensbergia leucococca]